jgi:Uma2 family endonuclease
MAEVTAAAQELTLAATRGTAPQPPARHMTYEQFLAWAASLDARAEWVDGQVILLPMPTYAHQLIAQFLNTLLNLFVLRWQLGDVLFMGYQMKLARSGREPDILFISNARQGNIERTHLKGPADLAIEIVSPDSVTRDRRDKYREYEAGGVPEYWIIDPDRRDARFYGVDPDGRYRLLPVENGVFHSRALAGFWLRVEWLWQDPPPTLEAARELDLLGAPSLGAPGSPASQP